MSFALSNVDILLTLAAKAAWAWLKLRKVFNVQLVVQRFNFVNNFVSKHGRIKGYFGLSAAGGGGDRGPVNILFNFIVTSRG